MYEFHLRNKTHSYTIYAYNLFFARYAWYALINYYTWYPRFTEDLRNEKYIYAWYAGTDFVYAWYSGTGFIYASYADITLFTHDTHDLRRLYAWYLDCVFQKFINAWYAWYTWYTLSSLLMKDPSCHVFCDTENCLLCLIGSSEPMQNNQTYFFSDIFLNFYNIIKIII